MLEKQVVDSILGYQKRAAEKNAESDMEKDGSLGMPDIYSDDAYAPDISFQPFQDMKFTLTFDSREEIPVGEDRYVTNIIFEVVKRKIGICETINLSKWLCRMHDANDLRWHTCIGTTNMRIFVFRKRLAKKDKSMYVRKLYG